MKQDKPVSRRTRVRRVPQRGVYDAATIHAILDEALICHVGFAIDGHPAVVPVGCARAGDFILLHCSRASRMAKALGSGNEVCVAVTHLDGLVLARSAFHHSMNYRSVVVYGRPTAIIEPAELRVALEALSEHLAPGRWKVVRQPSPKELRATVVFRLPLDEASAKIRNGPPADDPADLDWPVWAGVVPLRMVRGKPEAQGNGSQLGKPK
jgi:nitroimidazol reductase NimA-like FMN-containing flavoprotein (pyridoxamine 5'-phosphate oxidase superfamily)